MGYLDKFRFCPVCGSPDFCENDFKSKKCGNCGFIYYFNSAAACVAVITNEKGELLVGVRGEEPAKGTLDLIGGFVDPGEDAQTAIIREIQEETGIDIQPMINKGESKLDFLFSLDSTYVYSGLKIYTCDTFYKIQIPSTTTLQANDDVASCRWLTPEEVDPSAFGLKSIRRCVELYLNTIRQ